MSTYQICISGAAKGESVEQGKELARQVGLSLAKAGHTLLSGATTGLPELTAESYKKAGGRASLGLSPAATKVEHVLKYRLPTEHYDAILYTGLHYIGRDALLVNSADAVVSIGGRLGTLHEFTIAMETDTPVALLQGAGGVSTEIVDLMKVLPNANPELVIIETDPDKLVERLTALLDKLNKRYQRIYNS
jgi:uncharacterized protein (TIGR00725 family)